MYAIVYSDASYNDKTGKGGWAIYLRSQEGDYTFSGPASPEVISSNLAEMEGIYRAMAKAFELWGDRLRGLTVVADAQSAIRHCQHRQSLSNRPGEQAFQRKLNSLLENRPVKMYFRWQHGHHRRPQGTNIEAHISAICDEMAYLAMKAA